MADRSYRVVIPSGSAANLPGAVAALRRAQPDLDRERLVVVADRLPRELADRLDVTWIEGPRPFIFSRNVNVGVGACGDDDVVMMADDVEVITPGGFDLLAARAREYPEVGLIATGVSGPMYRESQRWLPDGSMRVEDDWLSFVCIYIPRVTWKRVGAMDERFDGYGFDDVDYSWRVRAAGLTLLIDHGCRVSHGEKLKSVFRETTPEAHLAASNHNERLLREKWNLPPMPVPDEAAALEDIRGAVADQDVPN